MKEMKGNERRWREMKGGQTKIKGQWKETGGNERK